PVSCFRHSNTRTPAIAIACARHAGDEGVRGAKFPPNSCNFRLRIPYTVQYWIEGGLMPSRIPEQATPFARALARGDRGALGEYATQVRRPLFSYALRLVGGREEAEDLAQEALTRLHEQAAKGKLRPDEQSIRALLFS